MVVMERNLQGNQITCKSMHVLLFSISFQMVPGWFDFVFVTVILVIGFEFGRMPLLPVLLSLIGKQAKNLVCVCFPLRLHIFHLMAAFHQSCTDLHGKQFQEIVVKGRYDFRNQFLWSFILIILFSFPLLFLVLLNMCF